MKTTKNAIKKWPYIPDHPYIILIIGGSGSGKTNALLNLIGQQDDIDKIYLHAKDLSEPKYEILIKKWKDAGIKHLNDPIAFFQCFNEWRLWKYWWLKPKQKKKKFDCVWWHDCRKYEK